MDASTGPPSIALTTLLNSLHTHLQTQTHLLPTLHSQLGLPSSALEDELVSLQKELAACVERQIEGRRIQVAEWVTKCEEAERECGCYIIALGGHVKSAGTGMEDMKKEIVLPRRYMLISEYQEKLRQLYHTKLEQLNTITTRILGLTRTVGNLFFTNDILSPTAAAIPGTDPMSPNTHRDVTPERFLKLEKELVRGKAEVGKRLVVLHTNMVHLDWVYAELGLVPPIVEETSPVASSSSLLAVPTALSSRPPSSAGHYMSTADPFLATPTPLGRTTTSGNAALLFADSIRSQRTTPEPEDNDALHERIFARFCARLAQAAQEGVELPDSVGLEGVEPTPALLEWVERTRNGLEDLKRRREAHIQALYDQLETLWRRLGVSDAEMDAFVDANQGSTEATIRAYEEELECMMELKREKMSSFVENARAEIIKLWDELLVSEEERAEFSPFADDEFTEELLALHETEIKRLKEDRQEKAPLLVSVRKYFEICEDQRTLEASANDQSRLLGRGTRGDPGRLLREEKMRKRVAKEKPKLEHELLVSVPAWEAQTGRSFLVHGMRIMDMLAETAAAAETAKENVGSKRKQSSSARAGSVVPTRATTPASGARAAQGKTSSTNGPPAKRQRLASVEPVPTPPPTTTRRTTRSTTAAATTGAAPKTPATRTSAPARSTARPPSSSTAKGPAARVRATSTTHATHQTQSRVGAGTGAGVRVFGSTTAVSTAQARSTTAVAAKAASAKDSGVRRESFKPRPSVEHRFAPALATNIVRWPGLTGAVKEE